MSEKKANKGKFFEKLHKLQKRLFRSKQNPGHHSKQEDEILKAREHKLLDKIKGKNGK